jgi:hypothetical protein
MIVRLSLLFPPIVHVRARTMKVLKEVHCRSEFLYMCLRILSLSTCSKCCMVHALSLFMLYLVSLLSR